jgi:hypothetical protein
MPVIPTLGSLKEEEKFETSVGYVARLCLQKQKQEQKGRKEGKKGGKERGSEGGRTSFRCNYLLSIY